MITLFVALGLSALLFAVGFFGYAHITGNATAMWAPVTAFGQWLRSVYSEPDGTGSSTRLHISLLTVFTIAVGISFAALVHRHGITIEQFNAFLGAAATFLVSTCGPLYGINKLSDWAKSKQLPPTQP